MSGSLAIKALSSLAWVAVDYFWVIFSELERATYKADHKAETKEVFFLLFLLDSKADCWERFRKEANERVRRDDDVTCTTEYSRIVPLENGEVSPTTATKFILHIYRVHVFVCFSESYHSEPIKIRLDSGKLLLIINIKYYLVTLKPDSHVW